VGPAGLIGRPARFIAAGGVLVAGAAGRPATRYAVRR